METSIEEALANEFLKNIREKIKQQEEYATHIVLERDEYVERVGYIKALREVREDFNQLRNAFFPPT